MQCSRTGHEMPTFPQIPHQDPAAAWRWGSSGFLRGSNVMMKSERVMHLGKVWFVLQIVESGTYNTQSWRPTYRSRREELRVELVVWWFSQVALCAYLLIQESQVIGGEFGHNCIPLICLLGWLCLCGCSIIYFGIFNLYDLIFQLFQHILMYFNCDAEDRDVVSWLMGWFASVLELWRKAAAPKWSTVLRKYSHSKHQRWACVIFCFCWAAIMLFEVMQNSALIGLWQSSVLAREK